LRIADLPAGRQVADWGLPATAKPGRHLATHAGIPEHRSYGSYKTYGLGRAPRWGDNSASGISETLWRTHAAGADLAQKKRRAYRGGGTAGHACIRTGRGGTGSKGGLIWISLSNLTKTCSGRQGLYRRFSSSTHNIIANPREDTRKNRVITLLYYLFIVKWFIGILAIIEPNNRKKKLSRPAFTGLRDQERIVHFLPAA